MRFFASASLLAVAAPALISARPVRRTASATDILVLKFADVLEQLESQFYSQALQKFQESDFTSAGFSNAAIATEQFTAIQSDEATHASILEDTITSLGDSAISGCSFDFSSALTDVPTMAATARVVENLGVAAYLGAAHLLDDPVLLTAAGSILTVEARHQTVLNIFSGSGSAIPSAFDLGFTPSEVLAIASPFISGCDTGVPANPSLSITNQGTVTTGTSLSFSSSALNGSTDGLFCNMLIGGLPFAISLPFSQCVVPAGINGPVAIWIMSDDQPVAASPVDRDTSKLVAGPTMAFIDTISQSLPEAARTVSGTSSSSSSSSSSDSSSSGSDSSSGSASSTDSASTVVSTSTISSDQASSIIASASATASGAAATSSAAASGDSSSSNPNPANDAAAGINISFANMFTGPSPDGHTNVIGWTNI
ncbi:hypothetical protein PUNSTDRAFT_142336 [Punctularia strigosozonata HHB-11173 SS5]|uniref:uncharacterized protein n=1 Tax=Punctularia strigosozonata (strain HHB-11173) TaxID=741275 RepID=UPI000441831A|nr:uncharacterized protein PUNSTDRAFT_142336 [Punctularia strigosozonata HHB-11173 SS5]EIN10272.1 hypothetical protein PUNSTDRAFT_142336 [Punctularia strigosozonata HHB-11173 SS5]